MESIVVEFWLQMDGIIFFLWYRMGYELRQNEGVDLSWYMI